MMIMSGSMRTLKSSAPALPYIARYRPQAVDLAFRLAVAPGEFNGVADGADVTVEDPRERAGCLPMTSTAS